MPCFLSKVHLLCTVHIFGNSFWQSSLNRKRPHVPLQSVINFWALLSRKQCRRRRRRGRYFLDLGFCFLFSSTWAGMSSVLLLLLVFVFNLIAFGLAVAAEQRRITWQVVRESRDSSYCVYDKDIAAGLGIGSLLVLLASQLFIMVASRCLCCGRALSPSRSRSWAIVLFITTWVFFFIAEMCLLAGSVRNAYHTKYRVYFGNTAPSCRSLRKGVFGAGAAFVVLTGIVSELYYVTLSRAKDFEAPRDPGIRMNSL